MASAVLLPVQLLVVLRWPQGYSVRDNAISDLGVTVCGGFSEQGQQVREVCSPWHQLFNAGMVVSGVLIVIGALLLHGWWDSRSGRTGTSVIALTGLSVSIVGLAPWDTHPGVHDFAALGQAVTQWLAMGLLAVAAGRGHFRRLIIVALVVPLVGFAAFLAADIAGRPRALLNRRRPEHDERDVFGVPAHGELRPRLLLLAGSAGESDALEYRFDVGFRVGAWRPVAPKQHLVDEGSGELTDEVAGETVIQRGGGTADEQVEDRRQRPVFQRGLRGYPHRRDYAEARPGCGRSR